MIIVRIAMHARPEKQKEVMQTLLSMIESTGKERGCLSHHVFRDIEDENIFSLIDEWETREDLDQHIRSAKFGVLLGTKSLLCEPPPRTFKSARFQIRKEWRPLAPPGIKEPNCLQICAERGLKL